MQARASVLVQDSNHSVTVVSTSLLETNPEQPLTCGVSTLSSLYNLGELVVTCLIHDMNDKVIGVKSIVVSNIEEVNNGRYQSSKVTISEGIPSTICNHGGMSNTPITLDLSNNPTKYVLLSAQLPETNFSSVLQTNGAAQTTYSMSVFTASGNEGFQPIFTIEDINGPPTSDSFIGIQSSASSSSRYKINGEEVYPHTHTVGMANATIPAATNIAVKLSATSNSAATYGKLYTSSNFSLRAISGSATATSVTAYLPYGAEIYGLVINGKVSGQVPTTYSSNPVSTSSEGVAIWDGISLTNGDYYSVVSSTRGKINPFGTPVLTNLYTS